MPRPLGRFIARHFTRSQCAQVQALIAPSEPMRAVLDEYGVRTPIHVLPTGLAADRFHPGDGAAFRARAGIAPDRPLMTYIGRVAHEKNIGFLVQVLRRVLTQVPQALLVIAGEGPAREALRAQVAALGLAGAACTSPATSTRDTELLDCYAAADAFVFASRTETQGLVLLEAMAQGAAVVSTAELGTRSILVPGSGALVVPEEEGAFAAAVVRVLQRCRAARGHGRTRPRLRAHLVLGADGTAPGRAVRGGGTPGHVAQRVAAWPEGVVSPRQGCVSGVLSYTFRASGTRRCRKRNMSAKRALIVDDSKSARLFLARVLQDFEIDVDSAESAEAAIDYLSSNRPDVIFMDHQMPGMDGLQAVQAIKNDPRTATIPIMMYTSQEGELYLGQARALGALGVLPKQIKPTDVSKVLYQLHLVPDRRVPEQSTFTPVGAAIADTLERSSAASRPLTDSTLREHFAELRRALIAVVDTQTDRITAEVRALVREALPLPGEPAPAVRRRRRGRGSSPARLSRSPSPAPGCGGAASARWRA